MEMLGDLTQSFQAIVSIAQKLKALGGRAKQDGASEEFTRELNGTVIEMQDTVMAAQAVALDAQAERGRLASRVAHLEEEAVRSKDWVEEKARYALAYTGADLNSTLAYKLRDEARRDGEPEHFICAKCYEDGIKSIMQPTWIPSFQCPRCLGR